jgi:hypothetical protein
MTDALRAGERLTSGADIHDVPVRQRRKWNLGALQIARDGLNVRVGNFRIGE